MTLRLEAAGLLRGDLYRAIEESGHAPARGVCFERYLCDGRNGNWDVEIWQSVEPVASAE